MLLGKRWDVREILTLYDVLRGANEELEERTREELRDVVD